MAMLVAPQLNFNRIDFKEFDKVTTKVRIIKKTLNRILISKEAVTLAHETILY